MAPGLSFHDFPPLAQAWTIDYALYDHDREVVFLPRAVPRKVTHRDDADVKEVYVGDVPEDEKTLALTWPNRQGKCDAAGNWSNGKTMTNGSSIDSIGARVNKINGPQNETDHDKYIRISDQISKDLYGPEPKDDIDHWDSHELIGMIYERKEPSILLVSKEIRKLALPLYYSENAFSWRFLWMRYEQSFERFGNWVESVGGANAKFIRKISFEGRHAIEEGIEYEADIDILSTRPFYSIRVAYRDVYDPRTAEIAQHLRRDLIELVEGWIRWDKGAITMSQERIWALGQVFVKGLHRDAGGVECKITDVEYDEYHGPEELTEDQFVEGSEVEDLYFNDEKLFDFEGIASLEEGSDDDDLELDDESYGEYEADSENEQAEEDDDSEQDDDTEQGGNEDQGDQNEGDDERLI